MVVAFYKGRKRLFNRLVSWWLLGPYSHVELVLSTDSDGFSKCVSSSIMDGGVRVKGMYLDPDHWDLIEVSTDPTLVYSWIKDHEGEKYDYLGLIGLLARILGEDKNRSICSESVGAMLGLPEPWRFDPCSLYAALTRPCGHTLVKY